MKKLIERITGLRALSAPDGAVAPPAIPEDGLPAEPEPGATTETPVPKPPPDLPLFFMLSHLDDDGPVRQDGVKLGVCEVMGLEIDEPKLGAFAGALNALDFPAQLLVRQHPPRLGRLRENLQQAQPDNLPPQTKAASESLQRLLTDLEARDGILDRRFYAVCESARIDDLRGLLARAGLAVHPLRGRQLRMFLVSAALGGSPSEFDEETPVEVEVNRREVRVGDQLTRSLHLGRWPRSLAPGFLQGLMSAGAPMDLSVHVGPIPAEQAARTLEWQKVRFESAQSLSFKRGRTMSPEAEIALEDITRLQRRGAAGTGAAVSRLPVGHAPCQGRGVAQGDDPEGQGPLRRDARQAGQPGLQTARGAAIHPAPGPERRGRVAQPGHVQHRPALPLLAARPGHPQRHPLRHRHAGLLPRGLRPLGRHAPERQHRRPGKVGKRQVLRHQAGSVAGHLCRGITAYVIDPEGEYADMARAAGGRVLSPGVPGEGMNPFVIDKGDSEEMLQRIGSLRRLIEVMVGESLGAARRASLDHALAGYYAKPRERTGFRDFYKYLQEGEAGDPDLARLLRPFATGSLRHLLSDEGDDLLGSEALVTVFDLRLLEPELRPAAAMVCTETVWAAAAQDPKPRLLVVDEVWSIMQHPEGAAFMVSMAKRARKHRLGLQFITQDVQDLLSEDTSRTITGHSGRALLQNAAFKLLLQQDAAAIGTVGDAFDLPEDLQRWLLSCPRGDGLLLARGNRFPVRIEATPEETAVIEWRPGRH